MKKIIVSIISSMLFLSIVFGNIWLFYGEINLEKQSVFADEYTYSPLAEELDTTPPEPNPMSWASPPTPASSTSITMTATKASDETPPIEYFFFCWEFGTNGANNSGWQESRIYVDDGLIPNTPYKYQVRARDNADPRNYGVYSYHTSTYTLAEIPGAPTLTGETTTTVNLDIQLNDNPSYTEFAIKCNSNDASWDDKYVDASGNPSNSEIWQNDSQWGTTTVQGLNLVDPDKYYCFRVKARNVYHLETALGTASFVNYTGPYPPGGFTASAVNRTKTDLSWTKGDNTDKTYIRYKQGAAPPSDREDGIFLYNDTGTSTSVTGLLFGTQYSFKAWSWGHTNNIWGVVTSISNATTDSNTAPEIPDQPEGTTEGYVEVEYAYSIDPVTDPEQDNVQYLFDWDDGSDSGWISSLSSSHTWNEPGTYEVKVKAKDTLNAESEWSTVLAVIITPAEEVPQLTITAPLSVVEGEGFNITVTSNGNLIENVHVTFNDKTYMPDSNRPVSIPDEDVPTVTADKEYTIVATKEGYAEGRATITVFNIDEDVPSGWIWGFVTDNNGKVIKDASVCVKYPEDINDCTFTDETGLYSKSVRVGTYLVEASKSGYESSTESVTIIENEAIPLDFTLEKKQVSSITEDNNENIIEYMIQEKGEIIGARMYVDPDGESISYYSDELTIELNSTEEVVSFTVSAENGTNGTILVIRIGEGVLEDLDNLNVIYDGVPIDEVIDIVEFFDLQDNTNLGWLRFLTTTGLYLFVRVPEFSEHTITISSIIEGLGGITAIISYIVIAIVVAIVIVAPIILIERKD